MTLLSFHDDEKIQEKYIARIKMHMIADEIEKGYYWQNGKGCAVGCTIHDSEHEKYEIELGIPAWLARVEDKIFENIPNHLAKEFPLKFLEAIAIGVDLNKILNPFLIMILESAINSFDQGKYPASKILIENVINALKKDCYMREEILKDADEVRAHAVTATAYAAAYAVSAAVSAAAYATAAAYAAAYAATAAAYAAAYNNDNDNPIAAYAIARENKWIYFSEQLLHLLRNAA
jgi:hypothetical protein